MEEVAPSATPGAAGRRRASSREDAIAAYCDYAVQELQDKQKQTVLSQVLLPLVLVVEQVAAHWNEVGRDKYLYESKMQESPQTSPHFDCILQPQDEESSLVGQYDEASLLSLYDASHMALATALSVVGRDLAAATEVPNFRYLLKQLEKSCGKKVIGKVLKNRKEALNR